MITGVAGTVGARLAEYFINKEYHVLGVDINEAELTKMKVQYDKIKFTPIPMDFSYIDIKKHSIDCLIHCAAIKSTIFAEQFKNYYYTKNVIETQTFLNKAIDSNITRIIFLSSDEANFIHNEFGRQKRIIESELNRYTDKIIQSLRFPFILESSGSVYHIFKKQAQNNLNLTVTDRNSSKIATNMNDFLVAWDCFFNNIFQNGCFRLSIGKRIKIIDLAQKIIEEERSNSNIEIIGIREGEIVEEQEYTTGLAINEYVEIV